MPRHFSNIVWTFATVNEPSYHLFERIAIFTYQNAIWHLLIRRISPVLHGHMQC